MKQEMRNWMDNFNKTRAKFMLTDSSIGSIVAPEVQEWIVSFLFPTVIQKGIIKYAILLSEDLVSKMSVEQMFDEDRDEQGGDFQQFFFKANEEDKAIQWFS